MTGSEPAGVPSVMPRRAAARANLAFSYVSLAVTLASGILLVPAYLRSFGLGTYGAWLASGNVLGFVALLDLGLNLVFAQRLATASAAKDDEGFAAVAGAGMSITACSALLVLVASLSMAPLLPRLVGSAAVQLSGLQVAFVLAAIGAAAGVVQQSCGAILQAWMRPMEAGLGGVAGAVAGLATVVAGLVLDWGVVSLGAGAAVRGLVGALWLGGSVMMEWRRRRMPRPRYTRSAMVALVSTAAPMFGSRLAGTILGNSEAAVVSMLVNPEAAAVVALTGRVFGFVGLLVNPVAASAFTGLARLATEAPARVAEVVRDLLELTCLLTALTLGLAAALNPSFVRLWTGQDSFGGLALSGAMALAAAAVVRGNAAVSVLTALGMVREVSALAFGESLVRLGLMAGLVRWFGILGIPLATLVSTTVVSGVPLVWLLGKAAGGGSRGRATALAGIPTLLGALAAGLGGAVLLPGAAGWPVLVAESAGLGGLASVLLYSSSMIARRELDRVWSSLRARLIGRSH